MKKQIKTIAVTAVLTILILFAASCAVSSNACGLRAMPFASLFHSPQIGEEGFDEACAKEIERAYRKRFCTKSIKKYGDIDRIATYDNSNFPGLLDISCEKTLRRIAVTQWTRTESAQKLERIGAAIQAYEHEHGHALPPYVCDAQGVPLLSWRVLLLPYLGKQELYDKIRLDEPWDSEWNKQFRVPDAFRNNWTKHMEPSRGTPYTIVLSDRGETPFSPIYFSDDYQSYDLPADADCSHTILVAEQAYYADWLDPKSVNLSDFTDGDPKLTKLTSRREFDGTDQFHAITPNETLLVSASLPASVFAARCLLEKKKRTE